MFSPLSLMSRFKTAPMALAAFVVAASAPSAAFAAESTALYWRNTRTVLSLDRNLAPSLVWAPSSTASQIVDAKAILRNESAASMVLQCDLSNDSTNDIATVTLGPNEYATVTTQITHAASASGAAPRFTCYVASGAGVASAQWVRMRVRTGAPSISVVAR